MNDRTKDALDKKLEYELVRNERVVEHPRLGKIRLRRATPWVDERIAEVRADWHFRSLENPRLRFKSELEAIYEKRGIWSKDKEERIVALSRRSGELMAFLEGLGYDNSADLVVKYQGIYADLEGRLEKAEADDETREAALEALARISDLDATPTLADRKQVDALLRSTVADDLFQEADRLRMQIDLFLELADVRKDLDALQEEQAGLFHVSIEANVDRAEMLAKVYYCTANADSGEPLWETFDRLWHEDPVTINEVRQQLVYFELGIEPRYQKILERHGFSYRMLTTDDSSDAAPEHPTPSTDGAVPAEPSEPSTASETPTSSTGTESSS
jgi:hypothetical protein